MLNIMENQEGKSMALITVDSTELENAAIQCQTFATESEKIMSGMQTLISGGLTSWQGAAKVRFEEQFEEIRPYLAQLTELLTSTGTQLQSIASGYETQDQGFANQMGLR
jgi:WXG100 family type VII secretion target